MHLFHTVVCVFVSCLGYAVQEEAFKAFKASDDAAAELAMNSERHNAAANSAKDLKKQVDGAIQVLLPVDCCDSARASPLRAALVGAFAKEGAQSQAKGLCHSKKTQRRLEKGFGGSAQAPVHLRANQGQARRNHDKGDGSDDPILRQNDFCE